jgi:glycerate-2-kinase
VTCALAGIAAVDPGDLTRSALAQYRVEGDLLIIAAGKAAGAMTSAALVVLNAGSVTGGVLISPDPVTTSGPLACFVGGHPIPNERGADGAREIARIVGQAHAGQTVLCLLSGGASSLMTLPASGLSVDDISTTTALLLQAGATIHELNCVRKHLDRLKGGRLATLAFPARVIALVLSDVVNDSLATIASGPTVADPTTIADAIAVLRSHELWDRIPSAVRMHLESGVDESPESGDARLNLSESHVIGNNAIAAEAACAQANALGYAARIVTTSLTGEARDVGARIVSDARNECARAGGRIALIYAGEPTVTVRGNGSGGRSQELVLGAALAMDHVAGMAVASLGTDGVDGPTDAAGAVADGQSIAKARALGLDPSATLAANDTHTFWKALGALVRTGPTGTNVMDIIVALAVPATA